ncbi:hypothetical protein ACWGHA_35440 [Streptomyces xanthophaeus]
MTATGPVARTFSKVAKSSVQPSNSLADLHAVEVDLLELDPLRADARDPAGVPVPAKSWTVPRELSRLSTLLR